ncbi:MAG TPA: RT0821/Lpp0805 family surface protein [Pseudolabrys sp.]|nr:RT0821/Lpp0805 family surface protein [Pseudolabrys sp.]
MAGALTRCFASRLYSGSGRARLWRAAPFAGALTLALAGGGCSISMSALDPLFGGSEKSETTGSITPPPGAKGVAQLPPDGDLAYARAAASDVLASGGKDSSAPWENPRTGARGTVTPIASAYTQDGLTCRDFLASYVQGASQAWMQGEACKQDKGSWEVRALRPWKRS